jgi:hypothetical protein
MIIIEKTERILLKNTPDHESFADHDLAGATALGLPG